MNNILAKRQEKDRGVSVQTIIDELNHTNLEQIAVVGIDENEGLVMSYSLSNRLELIGILEALKSKLIDEMNYTED
ncbi:hypothetical protein [Candidatus Enterococcus ikei]|uniref:Uncharacterized protein n=1 Tax=Candidatus Enterococcus ikei TaxID=2815326 RepID=A0ABS3GUN0_9ENTE|nr:hypothetical protein [Enterococcus sp. DIV0869a]MBO0438961.1 hypothetical protein [Enterococcus sp. DIV0869a]